MGPKSRRHEAHNDTIRFLLNGQARELGAIDPNMTVLNYLRRVERKTGTKEGCAEGDCIGFLQRGYPWTVGMARYGSMRFQRDASLLPGHRQLG